jgi:outer membrane lipoprotein SlyB
MKPAKTMFALAVAAASVVLTGCTTTQSSGRVYTAAEARSEQTVRMGVVESVREVRIAAEQSPVGTLAGGAIGGIAGSNVGGGRGATVGTILGAVGGAVAGSVIERNVMEKKGVEITVRLDNGELRAITQEADEEFKPGQRVRLLSNRGVTRVSH